MRNILLGITGSISAYKAADIANRLNKQNINVTAVMTNAAQKFITPLTIQTLSKNKVYTDMFDESEPKSVAHIALAENADVILIAPATANTIAKIANGIADNMLTSVILAANNKPVIICPAMNTNMYDNEITQRNIAELKSHNAFIIEPRESHLACGTTGKGALASVQTICDTTIRTLKSTNINQIEGQLRTLAEIESKKEQYNSWQKSFFRSKACIVCMNEITKHYKDNIETVDADTVDVYWTNTVQKYLSKNMD